MPLTFNLSQHIAAPPEVVFERLANPENLKHWMPGLLRTEHEGGPALGLGTQFRQTRRLFGREATELFEITRYEPPRTFTLMIDGSKGSSKRGFYVFTYTFSPANNGTRLEMHGEITGSGWLMALLGKLFIGSMKKAIAADYQAFARWVEQGQVHA